MTLSEAYNIGKKILEDANIESSSFDAMCIFNKCFEVDRMSLVEKRNINVSEEKLETFFSSLNERKNGRPLQYILGSWSFMGNDFFVGEGVLIPRDDTEVLVRQALKSIENIKSPKILDLCAGSGTVCISLAKERKDAKVTAVELSDIAFKYLEKNIVKNATFNITALKKDIFSRDFNFLENEFDIIVSNPPYIPSEEINNLQKEVKLEPTLALDGGNDGLKFYKEILNYWTLFLKSSGKICVEIGFDQGKKVSQLFRNANLYDIIVYKDINNCDRAVCGTKI